MPFISLHPCPAVRASIRPPGSKSITNRALVCAALAEGESTLHGVLASEDTAVMMAAWRELGIELKHQPTSSTVEICGTAGKLRRAEATLDIANSGTTIRFLTAALSACPGKFELDGVPRMRERPIGDLVSALQQLGAQIRSLNTERPDCPPVRIEGSLLQGGRTRVGGNISSQFLSGLMMAAPLATGDVEIQVSGELVSVPYVQMTAAVMRSFGIRLEATQGNGWLIPGAQTYHGTDYDIEPDASAASYYWAAAAITGGQATIEGLSRSSLQGDVGFCEVLKQMGCEVEYGEDRVTVTGHRLSGIDVDMNHISDTVQTLAAVALFAEGTTRVRGVAHNRVKETDRIGDLATELRKLGAAVQEFEDGLAITPPTNIQPAIIETYQDHRMAMSLALVGLKCPGIEILDPACTAKTYPDYWQDISRFSGCRVSGSDGVNVLLGSSE